MTGVVAPVWRATAVTRTGWRGQPLAPARPRGVTTMHAVRGAHTLCGLNTKAITWAVDNTEAPRCALCGTIPPDRVTSHDLTATGLTYRQVDHWCRAAYLRPDQPDPGSGRRRTFPPGELEVARVMAALTAAGVSPGAAARAARNNGWLTPNIRADIIDGAQRGAA